MLKNLKPYWLEESTGKLNPYKGVITISIKRNTFTRSPEPEKFIKIHSTEELKYTNLNVKLKNKHVYLLFEGGNNGGEICVCLTFIQNIRFKLMNIDLKTLIKILLYPLKFIKDVLMWFFNKE